MARAERPVARGSWLKADGLAEGRGRVDKTRMIVPKLPSTVAGVAAHYDELDLAYRRIWGEHVHHGYWRTGGESPAEAADALAELVEERLALKPGQMLCDIGCGYGATAARIAARHDVGIIGLTLSAAQEKVANARPSPRFTCLLRDWLHNDLPDASFDRAYAIESSEHMVDKARFFTQAARVLRPGGRLVVCAWLAGEDARPWEIRHLLEPICREGQLPGMGSRTDYEALAANAGFALRDYEDASARVRRTWTICLRRFAGRMVTDPALRRLALSRKTRNRSFILSLPRLILALRTGAMRYGIFVWEKGEALSCPT
ncbi:class I SAM-dependent methyltransferase [Sphingobium sp.]|uniref:class I SAM-dependent methyltransferase n=1 Tax=Sphingobium sp. TaxID=1912891 RepID=UPI0028BE3498|nr:class I SAM-dependent methyltransferase [Sphingobium sp.]